MTCSGSEVSGAGLFFRLHKLTVDVLHERQRAAHHGVGRRCAALACAVVLAGVAVIAPTIATAASSATAAAAAATSRAAASSLHLALLSKQATCEDCQFFCSLLAGATNLGRACLARLGAGHEYGGHPIDEDDGVNQQRAIAAHE